MPVPDLDRQPERGQRRHPTQATQPVTTGVNSLSAAIPTIAASSRSRRPGGQDRVVGGLEGELHWRGWSKHCVRRSQGLVHPGPGFAHRSRRSLAAAAASTTDAAPVIRSPRQSSRARTRSRAASCATAGNVTSTISPSWSNRAKSNASRASVLTRSPGARCILDGAATRHMEPDRQQSPGPDRTRSAPPHRSPRPDPATTATSRRISPVIRAQPALEHLARHPVQAHTRPPIGRAHRARH